MPDSPELDLAAAVAAVILAATFVVAAGSKLRDRRRTADDFASLGLPAPDRLAVLVPAAELLTAVALTVTPGWGGVLAFGLLAGFTTHLTLVMRSGLVATCACFGGASAKPISARHLFRNAVLAVLALVAATFDGWIWGLL